MTLRLEDDAVARMMELTEGAAFADLLRAAPPDWRTVAEETPAGWLLIAPGIPMILFNRLVGCGAAGRIGRSAVDVPLARLRAAGVADYAVQLGPGAQVLDIRGWLGDAGLEPRDRWAKVYRGAEPAPAVPTDLRIELAGPEQAAAVAGVATTGFGMPAALGPWIASIVGRPGWRHYLAWSGDDPVATAALFVRGDIGWLGVATTLPAARRRGAQSALMARRIEDGRALGCRWFVTETGEETAARPNPSFHNMLRAGFTLAYQRDNFMPVA
jgi:hypothetical protein